MLTDAAGFSFPATGRTGRVLVLLVLAARALVCAYAATVVGLNLTGYAHPGLTIGAWLLALAASGASGALIWRAQAVSDRVGLVDAVAAVLVQVAVILAMHPADRSGSLNWALAYSDICAAWLALGRLRWWRAGLAGLLGVVYGVGALGDTGTLGAGQGPAKVVTALVNAISPPLYFAISAAIFAVILRFARDLDAGLLTEQRQRGEAARLAERQRLFRDVHSRVLTELEAIAFSVAPAIERRAAARAEAMALRRAFADPDELAQDRFSALLADVISDHDRGGWTIQVVDEEIQGACAVAVIRALCAAVAELVTEATGSGGAGQVVIRACADDDGASVIVRIAGGHQLAKPALDRALARLDELAGSVSMAPALPGESRILLRVRP